MRKKAAHKYHLVDRSPWPFLCGIGVFFITTSAVGYFNHLAHSGWYIILGFFYLIFIVSLWCRDIIREAVYEGHHTKVVQRGLKIGMVLFIISEVMFFVSFFWAFFHSGLAPTIQIGCIWPPLGIIPFNPFRLPLLNTAILLLSGATVTFVHYAIISNNRLAAIQGFIATILLAILFTSFQFIEYKESSFTIADSVFGSTFFMLTGFHGLHVIIGTILLVICFIRHLRHHFSERHHVGFEASAWYWHFVDVVWLFLYIFVYCWGSWMPYVELELGLI